MDAPMIEKLILALLDRPQNSAQHTEDLMSFLDELRSGELPEEDAEYIKALSARLHISEDDDPSSKSFLDKMVRATKKTEAKREKEMRDEEKAQLEHWNVQMGAFADELENEIRQDAEGEGILDFPFGRVSLSLTNDSGEPDLFYRGNEARLKQLQGYQNLADKCERLSVELNFERQNVGIPEELGEIHSLAPTLYHVDLVVSGWKK